MKVVIIFNQFGPYHYARLNAAGKKVELFGIEMFNKSSEYDWDASSLNKNLSFQKITLFTVDEKLISKDILKNKLFKCLQEIQPDVVAINGWSESSAFAALQWCLKAGVPAVVMSESTEFDATRNKFKESIKKQIVNRFSAALVGGTPHAAYMQKLGMPVQAIFQKYDVIDNAHFAAIAQHARQNAFSERQRLQLPEHYFLASSRFIHKKNLFRLLEAFAFYRNEAKEKAWHLVLLGDGTLRPALTSLIRELGIEPHVTMPGFKQYHELPYYYGLSKAFIHASTSEQWGLVINEAMASGLPVLVSDKCGSATDLIQHEHNGLLFDPENVSDIANKMMLISSGKYNLEEMAILSQQRIADFTPDHFAENLKLAALKAIEMGKKSYSLVNSLTLNYLIHQ